MHPRRKAAIERRSKTIPSILGATAVALFGLPVLLPVAALRDVLRGRRRLPTVRTYLFLLQYLINDSVEILLAPLLWVAAGFGTRLRSTASIERHARIQNWSVDLLEQRARTLLGITVEIDEADLGRIRPGPVIVISRHVSLFDSTLPGIACSRAGLRARGVIMAELLADPGFDLIYGRTGSVFIPRDDGPTALTEISGMTKDANEQSAFIIYPEGRLFTPKVRGRSLEKLAERNPERAERLSALGRLLPPRPGGLFALLDSLPESDVLLIDHRGLDRFPRLKHLAAAVPVNQPITVSVERIERTTIPSGHDERLLWLDDLWLRWDARLAAEQA